MMTSTAWSSLQDDGGVFRLQISKTIVSIHQTLVYAPVSLIETVVSTKGPEIAVDGRFR